MQADTGGHKPPPTERRRFWRSQAPVSWHLLRDPGHLLSLGLGLGLVPWMPGTMGSLLAFPFHLLLEPLAQWQYLLVVALLAAVGVYLCARTARALGRSDPGPVVWDEVVGCLLVFAMAPPGWPWLLLGFVLFRLFDITKPWPIGWADRRIPGGLGIILDDLLAGAYAILLMRLFWYLLA